MKKPIIHLAFIVLGAYLVYYAFAKYDDLSIYFWLLGCLGFLILSLTFLDMSENSAGTNKKTLRAIADFFSWFWY